MANRAMDGLEANSGRGGKIDAHELYRSGDRVTLYGAKRSMFAGVTSIPARILYVGGLVAIVAATFLLQWFVPEITDISWLFVICEKLMAGEHLYSDIMETNPPMSVMLYMPTLLLAHLLKASPELLEIFLTLLLVALSLGWTSRLLYATGQIDNIARYRLIGGIALAVLPLGCYSEREHLALLVTLPTLAITAARIDGFRIDWRIAVIAGLGEGLAVTIKPQMAFPIILAVAWGLWRMRSLRLAFHLEHWIGVAIAAIYGASVVVFFPDYFHTMMPLLMETYRPVRYDLSEIAGAPGAIAYYLMLLALLLTSGRRVFAPRLMVPMLASIGYFGSYIEQSKGWPYHLYPALGLMTLVLLNEAVMCAYLPDTKTLRGRIALTGRVGVVVSFVAGAGLLADYLEERQWDAFPLAEQIAKLAKHPTIAIISDDLGITNPLTRMVDGTFVGTLASQWITNYAHYRIEHEHLDETGVERMEAWIDYDRAVLAKDIRRSHPDFIVVDRGGTDWLDWARQSPELAQLISDYRQAGRANDIYLLARSDIAPDEPHPATGKFWRLGGSDRWTGLAERDEAALRVVGSASR
jgi:hypothetical protein